MNIMGDLSDLEQKFTALEFGKFKKEFNSTFLKHKVTKEDLEIKKKAQNFDCGYEGLPLSSSFVKILPEKANLFFAHNSGGSYTQMLKMFKRYEFRYHLREASDSIVPGYRLSFSSYPGAIHSMDDFYIAANQDGHNLAISATPIPIFNNQLWQFVLAKGSIFIGPRAMAATRLGRNPEDWAKYFSPYNSGTGNRQWVVVDMELFDQKVAEKHPLDSSSGVSNLIWVLEQAPGLIQAADQTQVLLNQTYWAGYGIPFYQNISQISGFKKMEMDHGNTFSYNKTALANIFRRDQANTTTLQGVINLMRSNLYKVDPLSEGNPRCAIGSRGDVRAATSEPEPVGVTDIKVLKNSLPNVHALSLHNSSYRILTTESRLYIAAGPAFSETTTDEDMNEVAPFSWSNSTFHNVSHLGQPDEWRFQPIGIDFV